MKIGKLLMLETRALKVAYIFDIRGLVAYELVAYEKKGMCLYIFLIQHHFRTCIRIGKVLVRGGV